MCIIRVSREREREDIQTSRVNFFPFPHPTSAFFVCSRNGVINLFSFLFPSPQYYRKPHLSLSLFSPKEMSELHINFPIIFKQQLLVFSFLGVGKHFFLLANRLFSFQWSERRRKRRLIRSGGIGGPQRHCGSGREKALNIEWLR